MRKRSKKNEEAVITEAAVETAAGQATPKRKKKRKKAPIIIAVIFGAGYYCHRGKLRQRCLCRGVSYYHKCNQRGIAGEHQHQRNREE